MNVDRGQASVVRVARGSRGLAVTRLGTLCVLLGGVLALLDVAGHVLPPMDVTVRREAPTPAHYYERSLEPKEAMARFAAFRDTPAAPEQQAATLFVLVRDSYLHRPDHAYVLAPWDDWVAWLWGTFVDERHLDTQDADLLWRRGAGFCHQAALIYAAKAGELGLDARVAWLSGHVVAEVEIPGRGWRAVDPDLGIYWDDDVATLASRDAGTSIRDRLVAEGYAPALAEQIAQVYASTEDNRTSRAPFWEDVATFGRRTSLMKWVVPVLLLVVGSALRRGGGGAGRS